MDFVGGDVIIVDIDGVRKEWRLSKIDSKLVKYFDEGNNYTQIPYKDFIELFENGNAVKKHSFFT